MKSGLDQVAIAVVSRDFDQKRENATIERGRVGRRVRQEFGEFAAQNEQLVHCEEVQLEILLALLREIALPESTFEISTYISENEA